MLVGTGLTIPAVAIIPTAVAAVVLLPSVLLLLAMLREMAAVVLHLA
jgi:hypothetical protein